MDPFSHYKSDGTSRMVDISSKEITMRQARARGFVAMQNKTLDLINTNLIPKGNVFEVARIAGIMAAKRTWDVIPMCHPLNISFVDLKIAIDRENQGVSIESEIRLEGKTGAEMEALSAVSAAALTIYDMCKAVDKDMVIGDICLVEKKGGKSDYDKNDCS